MFNNLSDIDFELIIEKSKKDRYKAISPVFPNCKGFGNTKEEAIAKLCTSISNFIKKATHSFLESHLLSNNYTEIVTDPSKRATFQHRVISLSPTANKPTNKKIFLQSIDELINSINTTNKSTEPSILELLNKNETVSTEPKEKDDHIFGINLCLN